MAPSSDFPAWELDLILQPKLVVASSSASNKPLYTVIIIGQVLSFQQHVSSSVAWLLAKTFRSIARWTTCGVLSPCPVPSTTTAEWAAKSLQNKPVLPEQRWAPAGAALLAALTCWTVLAWVQVGSLWRTRPGLRKILDGDTSQSREGMFSAGVMASSVLSYRAPGWYTWVSV